MSGTFRMAETSVVATFGREETVTAAAFEMLLFTGGLPDLGRKVAGRAY